MATDLNQATWKKATWYVVLTLLSVVVLFPIYMTLVRALSTPVAYIQEGQPLYPVDIQWDVFRRAWDEGDLGPKMIVQRGGHRHHRAPPSSSPRCWRPTPSPSCAFPFRRVLFAVFMATLMLPDRGHADPQRADHPLARTGSTPTRAWRCPSWPPPSARS